MMQINTDYQKLDCIKFMNEKDQERFSRIVEAIAPELQETIASHGSVYTLHDFDHHCMDIYKIIDSIILTQDAYKIVKRLSERELYILNLGVLLHDISMHDIVRVNRDNHAILSADIIEEMYHNDHSAMSSGHCGLSKIELKALRQIVIAHSDDKRQTPAKCAIESEELSEEIKNCGEIIRPRLLAAILRMADELDITSNRIGSLKAKHELQKAKKRLSKNGEGHIVDEEERRDLENAVESLSYWKRLDYILGLERRDDGIVIATTDDEEIEKQIEAGESPDAIANAIIGVEKKILQEFAIFDRIISSSIDYTHIIGMKGFQIKVGNPLINNLINEKRGNNTNSKKLIDSTNIKVMSKELSNKITEFIKRRSLLDGGHFYRRDGLCARDWVNVKEIIGTGGFFRDCESLILSYVSNVIKDKFKKFFLIGIDFSGMLIGSKVSMALNIPYVYAIPQGEDDIGTVSGRELTVKPEGDYDGVIIMTDVIVTYNTITNILKNYNLLDKEIVIIGVLYREPINCIEAEVDKELISKTIVLNKDFKIELQCNTDCIIRKEYGCVAFNLPSR